MKLFNVTNHNLTAEQKVAAEEMGVKEFVELPENLKKLWGRVPPELSIKELVKFLEPFEKWLDENAAENWEDMAVISGDFGATYQMVNFSFHRGVVPVYATTRRVVVEKRLEDGSVQKQTTFHHVRFRKF